MEDCQPVATPQSLGDLPEPADEHDPGVNDPNIPKYMSKYTKEHFTAAKRVLRYLQGTRDCGLLWKKSTSSDLHCIAYADADLGSERTIADRSLASTEFIAAAECAVMIVWTHNLCEELNLHRRHPTVLFQDNQSTTKVIKAVKGNYKIKGVDLKYHK
ncbi:Hypothetical protein PHPALM_5746, partial [Phytophthora palmivora]